MLFQQVNKNKFSIQYENVSRTNPLSVIIVKKAKKKKKNNSAWEKFSALGWL